MNLLRLAGVAVLSVALVAGPGIAAQAQEGDGVCTITVQLPETAESGQPFTMSVVEDSDCAGASGLQPFGTRGYLFDPRTTTWGYDGIAFSHTPGSGDASYQGPAPNPGRFQTSLNRSGLGYDVVLTTMVVTPATRPTPTTPAAKAVWVNDTLRIAVPYVLTFGDGSDEEWITRVDGKVVHTDDGTYHAKYGTVAIPRRASAGPAKVEIVGMRCGDAPDAAMGQCTDTLVYSATVPRNAVRAKPGQVSADALLTELKVVKETRSGSFIRSKFPSWVDADHDGENTRDEVLKAESRGKVTEKRHAVQTGRWISPYDGKTYRVASRLAIDHLVPLHEAWTSGAAAWTAKKRTAYANDIGYGASLIAVSLREHRSKGGAEPTSYLPPKTSYRCAYVRNWIGVKYRWRLSIDPTEKAALNADLTLYCIDPYVAKPAKPDLTALVNQPRN